VIPALLRTLDPASGAEAGRATTRAARARHGLARRASATALEFRGAHRLLARKSARILARVARIRTGEIALDSRALASYPFVIQRTVLRLLWNRPGHAGQHLSQRHLNALQSLLATSRGGSRVDLPDGWRAVRDRGHIIIRRTADASRSAGLRPVPGSGHWARGPVRGRWLTGATARDRLQSRVKGDEFFAGEAIAGGLQLRPAGPDEWFMPFGDRRPRRLGDFLSKQPVSRAFRARPMVLADARGILWVVGVRRSARAPLIETTRRALWVHAETP
jgi:tRNA(Ile)-lysidine synthase